MNKKMCKLLAIVLVLVMVLSMGSVGSVSAEGAGGRESAISQFKDPDYTSKAMARMWFPDASAGADDNDTIAKQINELAAQGFGGVEIAMLSDSAKYNNAQAKEYGWGTENWVKLMKKVFKAANAIPGGFVVDVTITAHWPPCVNTIDPNDKEASQEISSAFTKITADDLARGIIELKKPVTKTADGKSARFVFTDTLVAANVAKVTAVSGSKVTVDFQSLEDVTADTTKKEIADTTGLTAGKDYKSIDDKTYAGAPAGVPDAAYCAAQGWDYNATLEAFGPQQSNVNETNKIDADGNRKRLADWQYTYQTDLSGITAGVNNEQAIAVGDYVVIATYRRGTGQLFSGGSALLMSNRPYVPNYFTTEGMDVVTNYWDKYLLDDELTALMRENGGSIFEDSIEASKTTSFWVYDLVDELEKDDYAYAGILPSIIMGNLSGTADVLDFSNVSNNLDQRIIQDYNLKLGQLWTDEHAAPAMKWAKETLNNTFRTQPHALTGLDSAGASAAVDIPEGDNGTKGDGLRTISAAVNLYDKKYLSMEAVTGRSIYQINMADVLTEVTANFSHGVNRVVMHGTPYSKSINGFNADWPGWVPFGTSFGSAYTYRQAYWQDAGATVYDYIARNQTVLQHTTAKIDLAILGDKSKAFNFSSGNAFQNLLNLGYSYNVLSEALLQSPNGKVSNKQLYADGPGYKALILNEVTTISVEGIAQVLAYANAGLPIILYNSNPSQVYGTETGANNDAAVKTLFNLLRSKSNVKVAGTKGEIAEILSQMNISSYSSYSVPQLETTMYTDKTDGTNYYYMFNNAYPTNSGMLAGGQASRYKAEASIIKNAKVTLAGKGVPYILDALTGTITPAGEYTINANGTVTVSIDRIEGGSSKIIAVTSNTADFPAAGVSVTSVKADSPDYSLVNRDGGLLLRSNTAGIYNATLSNNKTAAVTVTESLEKLDLSNEDWNLVIESYGPKYVKANTMIDANGIQTVDPSDTVITTVDFGAQKLINWKDIFATPEQLSALGVDSMGKIVGVGYYSKSFTLPSGWTATTGAYLDMTYSFDQLSSVTVNGSEIVANNITDRVDIGQYLKAGENTITVKISTTMYNRARVESMVYAANTTAINNGLKTVTLTPYTELLISSASPNCKLELATPEVKNYEVDQPFDVIVTTGGDASKVKIVNESGSTIGKKSEVMTKNADGTKTWKISLAVGTPGERTLCAMIMGQTGDYKDVGATLKVTMTAPAPLPAADVVSATSDSSVTVNTPFTVTVKTMTTVNKVKIVNESGATIGQTATATYKDNAGVRTWTITIKVGSKGTRTFTALGAKASGAYGEKGVSFSITIG